VQLNTCKLACESYLCFPNDLIYAHVMVLDTVNSHCPFLFLNFELWVYGFFFFFFVSCKTYSMISAFLLFLKSTRLDVFLHLSSYIIEGRVCYLTMCDRSYPKKLAFQYLEDLKNEFERVNGAQIETAARPYAFIKFGKFLFLLK